MKSLYNSVEITKNSIEKKSEEGIVRGAEESDFEKAKRRAKESLVGED